MSENLPGYFAIIIAPVRYCKEIEPGAKLLYGELTALSNLNGYCWASNKYFSDLYNVEERTIQRWLESLSKKKFIKVEVERKGFQVSRKIFIAKENFTTRQKCQDDMTEMSGRHDKNDMDNNTLNNTSNKKNICAVKNGASVPEKIIERIQRRKNVATSDEEHAKLKIKCGELLEKCYDHLSEWKDSISEKDKKAASKHTDYYRITKWVLKAVQDSEVKKKTSEDLENEKINRQLFFDLKKKHAMQLANYEYSNGFILNKTNGKDVSVKMNKEAFRAIMHDLMGLGKTQEKAEKKQKFKPNGEEYYE